MATRSRIGVMHGTICKSVYCHWDGYPEHNGAMLQKHYNNSVKANHLVALGDISGLGSEIGEKHPFSQLDLPEDQRVDYSSWTTFYGRDREEENTEFKISTTFADFLEECKNCGAEYYYIMENGKWYFGSMYGKFDQRLVLLSEALESIEAEDAE